MKVSVLINNYNYGRFLRQCVLSVKAQDYGDVEIVIVDDGSTDSSSEVLAEFESCAHIIRQTNRGQFLAQTAGLAFCSGEYVFLLDSDDYWPANYISTVVRGIERHGKPDLVFCSTSAVDKDGASIGGQGAFAADVDYGYNYIISQYDPYVFLGNTTSAIAIKKMVMSAIFCETRVLGDRYVVASDDVLVVGADLLGYRKVFLSGVSVFYRVHSDSVSAQKATDKRLGYRYFVLKCMLFPLLHPSRKSNPYFRIKMPFAWEFETKANIPFAEALRYIKSTLLYGGPRRLWQAWRILAHWRSFGTSRNRIVRLALKPSRRG